MKRDSSLEQQGSLRTAINQEDEGAAYRIEELTRMKNLSEKVAEHTNSRCQDLNTACQEHRSETQAALGNMYSSAKDQIEVLRAELSEARRQCQYEEFARKHTVEAHGAHYDRYHCSTSKLHGILNKLYEEKASAKSAMSIREYDIAAMKGE